jgi:hypothetical protein
MTVSEHGPGGQEALAAAAPETHARLIDAIAAVVGPSIVIDTSFPRASLAVRHIPDATQVMRLPREPAEQDFLSRFRQAGGHRPIVSIDLGGESFVWPPPQFARQDRPRTITVAFENADAAAASASRLFEPGTALLVPASRGAAGFPAALSAYEPCLLEEAGEGDALMLLIPASPSQRGRQAWSDTAALTDDRRRTLCFGTRGHGAVLEAANLVHDGSYLSEGDAKYSWLWTGPSNHFRFIVPKAYAAAGGLAEICIPRTEDPVNLDHLAVQVNGRPMAHDLDRWSETSGKIKVPLPEAEDHWVLTLVVPRMVPDGSSGRLLGLCIDKVILSP